MRRHARSVTEATRASRTNSIPVREAENGPAGKGRATASQGTARAAGVSQARRQSSTRGTVRAAGGTGMGSGRAGTDSVGLLMRTGAYQPWVVLAVDWPNQVLMLPQKTLIRARMIAA